MTDAKMSKSHFWALEFENSSELDSPSVHHFVRALTFDIERFGSLDPNLISQSHTAS